MSDLRAKAEKVQKPQLYPASNNPWYLLATLHGEQPETAIPDFDWNLHAKNRLAWNRYIACQLSEEQRAKLVILTDDEGNRRFNDEELKPYDADELREMKHIFESRGGQNLPGPVVNFSSTKFQKEFFVRGFIFDWASFNNCIFSGRADFKNAAFINFATFSRVTFSDVADFDNAVFYTGVNFAGTTFSALARFDDVTFLGSIEFFRAQFEGAMTFSAARFEYSPPDFNGAPTLFEGTIWPGAEGWPPAPCDIGAARWHQLCYERLKKDAETHKKHRQEQFFFAKELECQQVIDGPWRGWLTKLYGLLSAYGTSIARPVFGFAGTWLLGAVPITLWMGGARADWFWLPKFKNALWMSIANVLAPLGFRKDFFEADMLAALPLWMKLLSGGQTLFGLLFLFLLGLALRNRFRMK